MRAPIGIPASAPSGVRSMAVHHGPSACSTAPRVERDSLQAAKTMEAAVRRGGFRPALELPWPERPRPKGREPATSGLGSPAETLSARPVEPANRTRTHIPRASGTARLRPGACSRSADVWRSEPTRSVLLVGRTRVRGVGEVPWCDCVSVSARVRANRVRDIQRRRGGPVGRRDGRRGRVSRRGSRRSGSCR